MKIHKEIKNSCRYISLLLLQERDKRRRYVCSILITRLFGPSLIKQGSNNIFDVETPEGSLNPIDHTLLILYIPYSRHPSIHIHQYILLFRLFNCFSFYTHPSSSTIYTILSTLSPKTLNFKFINYKHIVYLYKIEYRW